MARRSPDPPGRGSEWLSSGALRQGKAFLSNGDAWHRQAWETQGGAQHRLSTEVQRLGKAAQGTALDWQRRPEQRIGTAR